MTEREPLPAETRAYVLDAWNSGQFATKKELAHHIRGLGLERTPAESTIGAWINAPIRTATPARRDLHETGMAHARRGLDAGAIRSIIKRASGHVVTLEQARRWMTEARLSGLRLDIVSEPGAWARTQRHTVTRTGSAYRVACVAWWESFRAPTEEAALLTLSRIIGDFHLFRAGRFSFERYAGGRRYDVPLIETNTRRKAP